jgi:cell division protein FtsW
MAKKLAFDRILFTTVMVLVGLGIAMVYSASALAGMPQGQALNPFLLKQCIAAAVGLVGLLLAMHFDYRLLQRRAVIYSLLGGVVALLVIALLSPSVRGTNRWIDLGPVSIQPSELAKLVLVPYIAYLIVRMKDESRQLQLLLPAGVVTMVLAWLVFLGRDLGSALMLGTVAGLMLFIAGLPWLYLGVIGATLLPAVASSILLVPYRWSRLVAFLEPERFRQTSGFQPFQSLVAVGSGGIFGLGLGGGFQKLYFLPDANSDFVFAIIAEELGLAGALGVLLLFGVVLWRGIRAGSRAPDAFGRYLAWGITCTLVVQALIHISVSVVILPTTGITLPFLSYGGSSLVVTLVASGVLLNVSQHG